MVERLSIDASKMMALWTFVSTLEALTWICQIVISVLLLKKTHEMSSKLI